MWSILRWRNFATWLKIVVQVCVSLFVLGAGTIFGSHLDWPFWYAITLVIGVFFLAGLYVKSWGGLLGPHFYFDLIRLARRSRTRDVRVLYAFGLLVGLGLMYYLRFRGQSPGQVFFGGGQAMSINESAHFASLFVFTIIVAQNLAVMILTPVYVGSAISEEKERRTLEMLFTTHLKDREIIFGKLCSRLVHLGAVLLGGLPVLSLAQLWGGIDFQMILANFANTALNLLSVGSVSILVSAMCKKVATSVAIIYGLVLPLGMCLGIFSFTGRTSMLGLAQSDIAAGYVMLWGALIGFGMFHALISISCLSVALVVLRSQRTAEELLAYAEPPAMPAPMRRLPRRDEPRPHLANESSREPSFRLERLYDLPPVGNDPLFWKEMYLGRNPTTVAPLFYTGLGLTVAFLLLVFLAKSVDASAQFGGWETSSHELGLIVRVVCCMWATVCVLCAGFLAAGSIVKERQEQTIDALLTVPVDRGQILMAKWLASMFRGWGWWVVFAVTVVAGAAMTALQVSGSMVLLAAGFIHGAFFASLGLYFSVTSRTALSARTKMAIVALVLGPVCWINLEMVAFASEPWIYRFLRIGLNPVRTWYALGFSWREYRDPLSTVDVDFGVCLLGLGVYLMVAVLLWMGARRRFTKEARAAVTAS
ncbi:MAG: ABC transporter permease subunit [Planctomycetes bacterium]|nr:ABC transporter permease subunit [Planctomycetota bacterium]